MREQPSGRQAEALAAAWLAKQGYKLLARNWRNRWCEIDLVVADKAGGIHLVEVKYRRSDRYGSGLDHVTADKAHRLKRAALAWAVEYDHKDDIQIDVIAVSGELDQPEFAWVQNAVTN